MKSFAELLWIGATLGCVAVILLAPRPDDLEVRPDARRRQLIVFVAVTIMMGGAFVLVVIDWLLGS